MLSDSLCFDKIQSVEYSNIIGFFNDKVLDSIFDDIEYPVQCVYDSYQGKIASSDVIHEILQESLGVSKKVYFYQQEFDVSNLSQTDIDYYHYEAMKLCPCPMLRQYRSIYGNSNQVNRFLNGNLNIYELDASGSGCSRWWLFRADSGTKFMVSCGCKTFDDIMISKPGSIENIEFKEITNNQIKESLLLQQCDEPDPELLPPFVITSEDITMLKEMNKID